tara:strand:- start:349 stop:642 length:294 start_codon:yes stop_codon:yes gene_type:complete
MCSALAALGERVGDDIDGALGIMITDGSPDDFDCTVREMDKLVQQGMRFVVIIVADDSIADSLVEVYKRACPEAPIVAITSDDDFDKMGTMIFEAIG